MQMVGALGHCFCGQGVCGRLVLQTGMTVMVAWISRYNCNSKCVGVGCVCMCVCVCVHVCVCVCVCVGLWVWGQGGKLIGSRPSPANVIGDLLVTGGVARVDPPYHLRAVGIQI